MQFFIVLEDAKVLDKDVMKSSVLSDENKVAVIVEA